MEKEYISARQCMFLLIGSIIGIAIMLVPSSIITIAKQDAWLIPWMSVVPGLVLIGLLVSLNKMYPGQSLAQYSISILGWPGKFLVLAMIWYFLFLGALVLREIVEFINSIVLFETPPAVIYFFTTLLCAYGLKMGLEVIARTFSILILMVVILLFIIQGYSMINADFGNMQPILSTGLLPLIGASIFFIAAPVGEVMALFGMVIYQVKKPHKLGTKLSIGFIFSVFILCLVVVRAIVILGPDRSSRSLYTIATSINAIAGGNLLLPLMTLNWFVFSLCELILCYYAFVTGVSQLAKLSDYKSLILPTGALFIVLGIYSFDNIIEEYAFSLSIWPVYSLPFSFGIPLLLWVAAMIKRKLKYQK